MSESGEAIFSASQSRWLEGPIISVFRLLARTNGSFRHPRIMEASPSVAVRTRKALDTQPHIAIKKTVLDNETTRLQEWLLMANGHPGG